MQERAAKLLGKSLPKKPLVCTFHSLCVRILKQEITALGYPAQFAICDRGDQEATARTALRDIRVGEKALKPADLLAIISRWKTAGIPPETARQGAQKQPRILGPARHPPYQSQ